MAVVKDWLASTAIRADTAALALRASEIIIDNGSPAYLDNSAKQLFPQMFLLSDPTKDRRTVFSPVHRPSQTRRPQQ